MKTDFFYESCGAGTIRACRWTPEGAPKAVFQIIHGIAEHIDRYDEFAAYLTAQGFAVVAEDHMGHGKSIGKSGTAGYFSGGWMAAVADSYRLLQLTRAQYPGLPYVLLGHSMGSFLARTLLELHPDAGLSAAIICGTGWQPEPLLRVGLAACRLVCRRRGEAYPSKALERLVFGTYNQRVEHPRTGSDWLCRSNAVVDAYLRDPLCGFTPSAGLLRDMLTGISYLQKPEHLAAMNKALPVFFIAGGDDPVGHYGKGVQKSADAFRRAGMQSVRVRIYPLCRHEILNEINRKDIYRDITDWLAPILGSKKS